MSDLVRELGGRRATARNPKTDNDSSPAGGRHAFDEDAVETPIFHALTRSGWRSRQHDSAAPSAPARSATDPVDAFHRDPLTAPIPMQSLAPASAAPTPPAAPSTPSWRRRSAGAHAVPAARHEMVDQGRHHRRREAVGSHW